MHVMLTLTVEHRDVYPPIFIAGLKPQRCRRVKEIRIKDDRAVLSVRDIDSSRLLSSQEGLNDVRTTIVGVEVPGGRSVDVVNDQPSGCLVQVGVVRRDPEIHIHCCEVGVIGRVCRKIVPVLEAPQLSERVPVADDARERLTQLFGDLEQQRAVEAVLKEGA